MAMHSSLMVAYRVWVGVREVDPHWINYHFSLGRGWSRANPIPKSLEASVMRILSRLGLKGWPVVVVVRSSLTFSKSSCMSSVHTQAVPFLRSGRRVAVMFARSGTKAMSWFASPTNNLSWNIFSGVGKSAMALYLLSSGLIPNWLTMWSAKELSFPISNFFKKLWCWGLCISVRRCALFPWALPDLEPRWWYRPRIIWPREDL